MLESEGIWVDDVAVSDMLALCLRTNSVSKKNLKTNEQLTSKSWWRSSRPSKEVGR